MRRASDASPPREAMTPAAPVPMTAEERGATLTLAGLFALRMFGMFVILPVFALYAETLPGGDDRVLVGIALGAYGLTQALLQVPFGYASDRFGRKPAIVAGLLIFAAGSVLAAAAPDIFWTIAGRALQGAGAISAVVLAFTADVTRAEVRTRAMAIIGTTIGMTFALSLVAGPLLQQAIGVSGIFALTAALAIAGIALVARVAGGSRKAPRTNPTEGLRDIVGDPQLVRLNYGVFALHTVLMALFVQVPFALREAGLASSSHWTVYLGVLVVAALVVVPLLRQADRAARGKRIFIAGVATLAVGQLVLMVASSLPTLLVGLAVFFTAFCLLEATLPALVSKFAPPPWRGTAVGVYSTLQFLGAFVGGSAGGALAQHAGAPAVFGFGLALTLVWLIASATMAASPAYHSNYSMGET